MMMERKEIQIAETGVEIVKQTETNTRAHVKARVAEFNSLYKCILGNLCFFFFLPCPM